MTLQRGIELFNGGHYWEAHEAWEEEWMPDRRGPDGGFYKGLIQVAAGCLHYTRRNRRGALNKWRSGADHLRPFLPGRHGLDLGALIAAVDVMVAELSGPDWPDLELPKVVRELSRGERYELTYELREAAGQDIHGEAAFVAALGARSVLDAGCGTGRVARELARRDIEVVGVDIDPEMLAVAIRKDRHLEWHRHDVSLVDLGRTFECVLMAGNLMIFVEPGREPNVVSNLRRHLAPGGLLVAGFALQPGGLTAPEYDAICAGAGLALVERWATWQRDPFTGGDYNVVVHRLVPEDRISETSPA
ncbi:MAG: hypothetical protein NVS9B1_11280 [Candidatus Dormibacteraceae bacterium]